MLRKTHREETIEIAHGGELLEVRGSDIACGLFVNGRPFVLHWLDCAGSIGQEILQNADVPNEDIDRFRVFTTGTRQNGISCKPISTAFAAIQNKKVSVDARRDARRYWPSWD